MSLRHSTDNLTDPICTICREALGKEDEVLKTSCNHRFHRNCLLSWLKGNKSCPQCRAHCEGKQFGVKTVSGTGAVTRSRNPASGRQSASASGSQSQMQGEPQGAAGGLSLPEYTPLIPVATDQINTSSEEENRIRNIVSAVVAARSASIFQDLDDRITRTIGDRVECALTSVLGNLNLGAPTANVERNGNAPIETPSEHSWPREMPSFPNNRQRDNTPIGRDRDNTPSGSDRENTSHRRTFHANDVSIISNAGKIANLINSWGIKFDGSRSLSVENFIYRIESQVFDTLGGNFNLLCDNAQCIFIGEAKEWYWRFRQSVGRVTWPRLCSELRTNFEGHKTDTEFKEDMRARKQGPLESFDDYRNAILQIASNLRTPLREPELVEILQRGLRLRVRQQLLYVSINSVSELRKYCLKGENLLNEVSKMGLQATNVNRGNFPRRQVNELDTGLEVDELVDVSSVVEVDEVVRRSGERLTCWNCRREGHRYTDCIGERTIFCYGCGAVGVYKPSCQTCMSGNLNRSEVSKTNLRKDPIMKN